MYSVHRTDSFEMISESVTYFLSLVFCLKEKGGGVGNAICSEFSQEVQARTWERITFILSTHYY